MFVSLDQNNEFWSSLQRFCFRMSLRDSIARTSDFWVYLKQIKDWVGRIYERDIRKPRIFLVIMIFHRVKRIHWWRKNYLPALKKLNNPAKMEYYANSFKKIKRHNIMTGQVLILVLKFRFKDFHVLYIWKVSQWIINSDFSKWIAIMPIE